MRRREKIGRQTEVIAVPRSISICLPGMGTNQYSEGFLYRFRKCTTNPHSTIDDDSPIILCPSAPHDFVFTKRDQDGTRGWISKTKQLALTEVNRVLTDAMSFCGANFATRELVFNAVELANENIRDQFAH